MDDVTAVRELLHTAIREVLPPVDLLESARAGGRRRRVRRRVGAGVVASALLLSGIVGVQVLHRPGPVRFAGPLFDGATHGDLAGDSAYLQQVLHAWDTSHTSSPNASRGIYDDLRGDATVVWAGTTPAGRAAVVAQDAYVHHHGDIQIDHEGVYQLLGMFGPGADGLPRLVGDTYPVPADEGSGEQTAWYVDSARTVLAVVDNGEEHGVSYRWTYSADGSATRDFTPIEDHDQVGFTTVPAGTTKPATVVRLPYRDYGDYVDVHGAVDRSTAFTGALRWHRLVSLDAAKSTGAQAMFRALSARRHGPSNEVALGDWKVSGTTPDGSHVLATEVQLDDDLSRVYVLTGSTVQDLGRADASSPLPVRARLPRQQGWLVASFGASLEYRIGTDWKPAGLDAALLPDAARQVRVTIEGQEHVVDLDR